MKIRHLFWLIALAAVVGCDGEGVTRPPPTTVKFFNAAANIEAIAFYREETLQAELNYGDGDITSFDSGPYDFNVDYTLVGETGQLRALTFFQNLSSDRAYSFVLVAPGGDFTVITAATEGRAAGATAVRWTMLHAFPGLGALDVYVEPEGTVISSATPRGSVSYEGSLTFEFPAGAYKIWLTTAGDPNDVVFESLEQNPQEGLDDTLVISDPGEQGTLDIVLSVIGNNSISLGQVGQVAELRAVNVVEDRLARDVYLDETTGTPLFESLPFGEFSVYEELQVNFRTLITTPIDNPGTEEASNTFFAGPGQRYVSMIAGDTTDGIRQVLIAEDKRSISGQATLRIFNGAGTFFVLHVFVVEPGTDITDRPPNLEIGSPFATSRIPLVPGDYEFWVRDPIAASIVAGPVDLSMIDGGVYGILLADGVGGGTVEIIFFDDFAP